MPSETTTIMEALKQSTWELHSAAEKHPFQQELIQGRLPREKYIAYLAEMYRVHTPLEACLRLYERLAPFAGILREYQYQQPYLLEDLRYFGVDVEAITPTAANRRLTEEIREVASSRPIALLGYHYVLEGSNNGSRFIAQAVRPAYSLQTEGTRYLDPYGDSQREHWKEFVDSMLAAEWRSEDVDALIEAARSMFSGMVAIFDELHAT
jgi:heme oxygenase